MDPAGIAGITETANIAGNAGNVGRAAASVSLVLSEGASSEILACSFLMATTMLVAYISKKHHWVYFPESYVQAPTLLYNLVFGESLVNDAVSIVLFRTFASFTNQEFSMASIATAIGTFSHSSGIVCTNLNLLLHQPGVPLASIATAIELKFASFTNQEFSIASIAIAIVQFLGISVGSILLGILVSLLCALILRFIDINSEFSKFELSLVLVSGYLSYSVAEMLSLSGIMALFFCGICNAHYGYALSLPMQGGSQAAKFELSLVLVSGYLSYSVPEMLSLSGIMALFFCGICNAHYGYYNISHASKISSKYAFEALSFMAEMFVFAYLGMQVVVMQHVIDWGLLLSAIPLCLLSRAFNVFPLSFLSNCTQSNKIPTNMILMMWLSGLRGAIAFALALNMPQRNPAIISTTLFVVVLTTVAAAETHSGLLCLVVKGDELS
ncbi:unnamed protein product [Closterium sp. Naga37s-1]|nr:unnamed protein product [Closterium sp. Naga37s-1]